MYPVMLNLKGRPCLVVGGGGVALRKIEGLLSEGAEVTVVAPEPITPIEELAEKGRIRLERRPYEKGEVGRYALGFAATEDRRVNQQVYEDGEGSGVWINVADEPAQCSFHLPARLRRGAFQLVVASAGEAPFVVRRMRQLLEKRFGLEWATWMEAAAEFRQAVRRLGLNRAAREACYDRFFWATVDAQRLRARAPGREEQTAWLKAGEAAESQEAPSESGEGPPARPRLGSRGFVSLVGAGPGDPGLLTLRGRARLLRAGAVVYDRLAETALPCELSPRVELHCVGKKAGHHAMPQEEINRLLVRLAREGKRVVRLKGGDPFVFGRGGEEAEALSRAGVAYEVIPCVTAGVAVPAYAGIPVTHRKDVVRVTLVTAHESIKEGGPQARWDLLASDRHATIVGYMGVTSLPNVVRELLAYGMDPSTPAAMIERGTTPGQKVVCSSVAELPRQVERAGTEPPALFVIGPAVKHMELLRWCEGRALFGQRIVVPRPAGELGELLELEGAEVVEIPLPVTPAARIVMSALPLTGCIFRSAEEVEALDEERDGAGWGTGMVAWCLSEAAARRARVLGWRRIEPVEGAPQAVVEAVATAGLGTVLAEGS